MRINPFRRHRNTAMGLAHNAEHIRRDQEQVAAWAKVLDDDQPGWANRMPRRWNITHANDCILFHVYGSYHGGKDHMWDLGRPLGLQPWGVFSDRGYQPYWQDEIDKRKRPAKKRVRELVSV
jgi:hypothetical protein